MTLRSITAAKVHAVVSGAAMAATIKEFSDAESSMADAFDVSGGTKAISRNFVNTTISNVAHEAHTVLAIPGGLPVRKAG